MPATESAAPLLSLQGLTVGFDSEAGFVRAVDGVDLSLAAGETLALVGESGCGKSVTAASILRLLPTPPARYVGGRILFEGRDLLRLPERELRQVRGNRIAMVFQEPMTSLNPVYTVGTQVAESLRLHRGLSARAARERTLELLARVGIPAPEVRIDAYPHQLSGGMKQRVMIAMALACEPQVLVADEPTTALDVTIQAQILDLLRQMQARYGMALLLITHDLGVVAEMANRVAVMYAGRIVESADVETLLRSPSHPYTLGLLGALPEAARAGARRLAEIPGAVPDPLRFPAGCRFHPRCFKAETLCQEQSPPLAPRGPRAALACHLPVTAAERAAVTEPVA